MYIMDLIMDICLTKNKLNNIPKWKFITKNKQIKNLDNSISEFLESDIFNASDSMITFLLSLDKNIFNNINNNPPIYCGSSLCMDIQYDNHYNTSFVYYPKSNRFEVWSEDIAYTIYRNTKISNQINNMWEPLTYKIKEKYLEIIIQVAEYISKL